jgi:hypothetical protein
LPIDKQKSFKSGDLWRASQQADTQPELQQFVSVIAGVLAACKDIVLLITTQKNIKDDPHTGKFTSIAEDGSSRLNSSKQLNIVNSLILHLIDKWNIAEPVDVIIDRSQAFGLDPQQEGIRKDQIRMHYGKLKTNAPDVRMVAADDNGIAFRDVLLLPDYFGYLVRKYRRTNTDGALPDVLSGKIPFYIMSFDLPAMIAAAKAKEEVSAK